MVWLQMLGIALTVLVLLVGVLTYLRARMVRPHEIEAQLRARLNEGDIYAGGLSLVVTSVKVSTSKELKHRLLNHVRRYPYGHTAVEVKIIGKNVDTESPFDEDALRAHKENFDFVVVKRVVEAPVETDGFVQFKLNTTDPDETYRFVRGLIGPVKGKKGEWAAHWRKPRFEPV